ncbi:hypothetical protein MJD09_07555, partial [bacterium]|nr:hypothetical protein [bacterium]
NLNIMADRAKYRADGFLARWMAGELSRENNQAFEQWVRSNPGERQYFDDLRTIWVNYGSIKLADGRSKAERWDQIKKRLARQSDRQNLSQNKNSL